MKKRVLLLAVSCREGGLCPGGIDLDNKSQWIRIVKDDLAGSSVQGIDIDFAKPLDVITFEGHPKPQGVQRENWVIDNRSCKNLGKIKLQKESGELATDNEILSWANKHYSYHGFWDNYKAYLSENEYNNVTAPSESIMLVTDVRIYKYYNKAKIDFSWSGSQFPIRGISMTDQDFYDKIDGNEVHFDKALIVVSIPKNLWINPNTGEGQAYKFVSRVFGF